MATAAHTSGAFYLQLPCEPLCGHHRRGAAALHRRCPRTPPGWLWQEPRRCCLPSAAVGSAGGHAGWPWRAHAKGCKGLRGGPRDGVAGRGAHVVARPAGSYMEGAVSAPAFGVGEANVAAVEPCILLSCRVPYELHDHVCALREAVLHELSHMAAFTSDRPESRSGSTPPTHSAAPFRPSLHEAEHT